MKQISFYKYIKTNNISSNELYLDSNLKPKIFYTKFNNIYLQPYLWTVITQDFYIFDDFERVYSYNKHIKVIINRQNEIKKTSQLIPQLEGDYFLLGGTNNYWHLLIDFIPRLACLKNLYHENIKVVIPKHLSENFFNFIIKVCNLLSLNKISFLEVDPEKLIYNFESLNFSARPDMLFTYYFYEKLFRDSIRKTRNKNLYIKRGDVERRKVLNEYQVVKFLKKYKYVTIDCSSLSIEEQMKTFSQAKNIIIPSGAAMANLIFVPNNINVIEIRSNLDGDFSKKIQIKARFNLYFFEENIKVGKELRKDIIVNILELEKLMVDKEIY